MQEQNSVSTQVKQTFTLEILTANSGVLTLNGASDGGEGRCFGRWRRQVLRKVARRVGGSGNLVDPPGLHSELFSFG